jgi:hypothetical protein
MVWTVPSRSGENDRGAIIARTAVGINSFAQATSTPTWTVAQPDHSNQRVPVLKA